MNKKRGLRISLATVFLVVFNAVFFLASGTDHPTSVWIAYLFIHLSYFMVLLTPVLVPKSSSAPVFGFSLYAVSAVYFLAELLFGIVIILLRPATYTWTLIIHLIISGIYATVLIANMIANNHSAENIRTHENEVNFIKECSSRIYQLEGKCKDKSTNRAIEGIYDLLHSSPSKSNPEAHTIEKNIKIMVDDLCEAVNHDDSENTSRIIRQIQDAVEERNRRIRTNQ